MYAVLLLTELLTNAYKQQLLITMCVCVCAVLVAIDTIVHYKPTSDIWYSHSKIMCACNKFSNAHFRKILLKTTPYLFPFLLGHLLQMCHCIPVGGTHLDKVFHCEATVLLESIDLRNYMFNALSALL